MPVMRWVARNHAHASVGIAPILEPIDKPLRASNACAAAQKGSGPGGRPPGPLAISLLQVIPRAAYASGRSYGSGPRTFALGRLALLDGVLDLLTFCQIVKAHVGDCRVVEEHIFTSIRLNETESFV